MNIKSSRGTNEIIKIKKQYGDLHFKLLIRRHKKYKNNDKLISVCIFRMHSDEYKSSKLYIDGLNHIINNIQNKIDWNLRIYYDRSIINKEKINDQQKKDMQGYITTFKRALQTKKCELYKYSFPDFIVDKIYHQGLFGTLTRFMPLFDFDFEKSKTVYVSDVDSFFYDKFGKIMEQFTESPQYDLLYSAALCYNLSYYVSFNRLKIFYPVAGCFIMKKKMDHKLFIQFLLDIKYNRGEYKSYIESYNKDNKKYIDIKLRQIRNLPDDKIKRSIIKKYNHSLKAMESINKNQMPYGIDEFFLGKLLNTEITEKKIRYILLLKMTFTYIVKQIRYANNYFYDLNKETSDILNSFFENILRNIHTFNKDNHAQNYFNMVNKIKYDDNKDKYIEIFLSNFMKLIQNQGDKFKKIHIDDRIINCVKTYHTYIINKKKHLEDNNKNKIIYWEKNIV